MASIIEMTEVSFAAQNQEIVKKASCVFEEGKTSALVGPSGGGKSTVLKLAAGLLVPNRGTVRFRGQDLTYMSRRQNLDFRQQSAVVFQDSALWANQNLYQNLELPLKIHFPKMTKQDRDKRIQEVLAEAGYKKDLMIRPAMLSMGEQKLVAFARAMLCRPNLLFLDEWTESLDESAARRLIDIVRQHKARGHTVIFVTHDFKIMKALADRIIVIRGGAVFRTLTETEIASDDELANYIEQEIIA
jgi:ABC-type lipoprotein export system ATPase subunit